MIFNGSIIHQSEIDHTIIYKLMNQLYVEITNRMETNTYFIPEHSVTVTESQTIQELEGRGIEKKG